MVNLEIKRPAHVVPSYSLTGDLLSYKRCHRQYRYYNGSSLPPSRPVQLWYGEFIHGVLEAAFRIWQAGGAPAFPWPCKPSQWGEDRPVRESHDIGEIGDRIELVLRAQGKEARSRKARMAAYARAEAAVNTLGPFLFPLIADAEKKVIGTRSIPVQATSPDMRAGRYELHGVIDVVTQIQLSAVDTNNPLRKAIEDGCENLPPVFEILADYKGAPRPALSDEHWELGDWQVQTYAWLRRHQAKGVPIIAGLLIYINELAPGSNDMPNIRKQIETGDTDVMPVPGSMDDLIIRNWKPGQDTDQLSAEFRFRRALRVVPVTEQSLQYATSQFDEVVAEIELSIRKEAEVGTIVGTWEGNCKEEETCAACDFRHSCTTPAPTNTVRPIQAPIAP
ncbi:MULTISPECIES: PD-(D/E)XK nuclease family protein [Stenotrophomonas]|jgi:hypothetical protein|uniref:PD-(D/E)XK nuclease family protein n=2 Tax=Lysobacteraceae TaxID=32033 RepID=UPI00066E3D0E|nr:MULTISPECIES: PD-(D/E)XK nuclease family protein [Stenotrophomonas]MBA0338772.1 hypothetical protein [Stenotrophomonas maltophilia]MBA0542865.1 hypothetical protein [Stenotrophomonas maltophilia]MBH1526123.1 PD-(D/E)XK nuclease family protein [Stenotrophomonas maltophilia]MBH1574462.1 PD-(D/E)XK nuclease family protein [Stenotrophomonas maltophilia]MBH1649913.1 PD-(D/E)XK nuclease family protein [Stenotrophomonas maltophilia]